MIKHIPIYYLTDIPDGTIIDGDNIYNITHIMVYQGVGYWCEILNRKEES